MAVESKFQPVATKRTAPAAVWTLIGVAVGSIWIGVVLAGAYAPDFVSGSQHEHLKVVGGMDWIFGLVATSFVVLAAMKGIRARAFGLAPWVVLAVGSAVVWTGVVLVSAFAPVWQTGTDPTIIPSSAMGAPILATFLIWFVCTLVRAEFEPDKV